MTNLLPFSYSKLTTFERCPKLGRAKYITKELPYVESEAARLGNEVHKVLEDHIREGTPLPEKWSWLADFVPAKVEGDVLMAEGQFGITEAGAARVPFDPKRWSWPKDTWFMAKIDLTQIEPDNVAWVIDWKTGKPFENPDQLNIYSCILKAAFPRIEQARGMYVWLKERRVGEVHTLSPGKTFSRLVERVKAVDTSDTPRKNKLCPYCDLSTCRYYTGEHSNG